MAPAGAVPEQELRRSIVRVLNKAGGTAGTGFLVSNDLIATCSHVIGRLTADDIWVELYTEKRVPHGDLRGDMAA